MTGSLAVDITIAAPWRTMDTDVRRVVTEAAESVWSLAGRPEAAELSVMLTDDETVRELNRTHRGKDSPTNVLAFPLDDAGETVLPPSEAMLLGDVVLAFETVQREAERDGKSMALHVSHLVIHGLLHLLGHDHERSDDSARMEALEVRAMADLGHGDPYAPVVEAAE